MHDKHAGKARISQCSMANWATTVLQLMRNQPDATYRHELTI